MRKPILFLTLTSLLVMGVVWSIAKGAPPAPSWLTGTTQEKVYRLGLVQPSYADFMLLTGIRFNELYVGAQSGKWEYAKHEALKIKENLEKAGVVDPRRREGVEGLISANYPSLIEAIDSQNIENFNAAFGKLYASCVLCHTKAGIHFMPLIPTTSISPITSGSIELWEQIQKSMRQQMEQKNK